MNDETKTLSSLIVQTCAALEREYDVGSQLVAEIEAQLDAGGDPLSAAGQLRGVLERMQTHDQRLQHLRADWNATPRKADELLARSIQTLKEKIQLLVGRIDVAVRKAQESAAKLQPQISQRAAHQRMRSAYSTASDGKSG